VVQCRPYFNESLRLLEPGFLLVEDENWWWWSGKIQKWRKYPKFSVGDNRKLQMKNR